MSTASGAASERSPVRVVISYNKAGQQAQGHENPGPEQEQRGRGRGRARGRIVPLEQTASASRQYKGEAQARAVDVDFRVGEPARDQGRPNATALSRSRNRAVGGLSCQQLAHELHSLRDLFRQWADRCDHLAGCLLRVERLRGGDVRAVPELLEDLGLVDEGSAGTMALLTALLQGDDDDADAADDDEDHDDDAGTGDLDDDGEPARQ